MLTPGAGEPWTDASLHRRELPCMHVAGSMMQLVLPQAGFCVHGEGGLKTCNVRRTSVHYKQCPVGHASLGFRCRVQDLGLRLSTTREPAMSEPPEPTPRSLAASGPLEAAQVAELTGQVFQSLANGKDETSWTS